jgi:predicted flap endonuclease-1-like 5' DNA nuclease
VSSLLTEILISLIVIAIIGGIIGWLIRGVQVSSREDHLVKEAAENKTIVQKSRGHFTKMEENFKKLSQIRKVEKDQFQKRINELEPLFDLVERRDNRIRELAEELSNLQAQKQSELDALQFNLSTRSLLGDESESEEINRLQSELNLANRQKDGAIGRYQSQVRQIEDLENVITEKNTRLKDVELQISSHNSNRQQKETEYQKQLEASNKSVDELEQQLMILQNKKQYEQTLSNAKAEKAEKTAAHASNLEREFERVNHEHATRENLLKEELTGLRNELLANQSTIVSLERTLAARSAPRPTAVKTVSTPTKKSEDVSDGTDLKQLKGIGPKRADELAKAGIHTIADMAAINDDDLGRITEYMPYFKRFSTQNEWISNARRIAGIDEKNANRG